MNHMEEAQEGGEAEGGEAEGEEAEKEEGRGRGGEAEGGRKRRRGGGRGCGAGWGRRGGVRGRGGGGVEVDLPRTSTLPWCAASPTTDAAPAAPTFTATAGPHLRLQACP